MEYRDIITGFKGICTGKVVYITGCDQALISPEAKEDGTLPEAHWIDVQRLELVEGMNITLENGVIKGKDKSAPIR
jgi:hypothetical protein